MVAKGTSISWWVYEYVLRVVCILCGHAGLFSTYLSLKHSEPIRVLNIYIHTLELYIVCTMIFKDTILHLYVTNNSLDTVAKDMEAV